MALQRRRITIPMSQPLDERTSEKLTEGMLVVQNGFYEKTGKLSHRQPVLTTGVLDASERAYGLAVSGPGELAVLSDGGFTTYLPNDNSSYTADQYYIPVEIEATHYLGNGNKSFGSGAANRQRWAVQALADDDSSPTTICCVVATPTVTTIEVLDATTYEPIAEEIVLRSTTTSFDAAHARICVCEDSGANKWFIVATTEGDGWMLTSVHATTGSVGATSASTVNSDVITFDIAQSANDAAVFGYAHVLTSSNTSVDMALLSVSVSGTISTDSTSTGVWTSASAVTHINLDSLTPSATTYWFVAWARSGSDISLGVADENLGTTAFPAHPIEETTTNGAGGDLTQFLVSADSSHYILTEEALVGTNSGFSAFDTAENFDSFNVLQVKFNGRGYQDTVNGLVYVLGNDGLVYVHKTAANSALQTTTVVHPVFRATTALIDAAGGNIFRIDADRFGVVVGEEAYRDARAKLLIWNANPARRMSTIEADGQAYVFGGIYSSLRSGVPIAVAQNTPASIAGSSLAYQFDVGPGGAGALTGTYNYALVWEFIDPAGQLHRSAPVFSPNLSLTSEQTTITMPIPFTNVPSDVLRVAIYATEAGGSIHYFVKSIELTSTELASGHETAGTITVTDNAGGSSGSAILYTDANELTSQSPPPLEGVIVHRNRIVGIDQTDRSKIWFSKQKQENVCFEFNENLAVFLPGGASATGLASVPAGLAVFTENSIFLISGDGPDNTGAGASFGVPRPIWSESLGCKDWRSVVHTSMGVFFQSQRGIELLTPGLQVQFIGAQIQDSLGTSDVDTAWLHPVQQTVLFSLQDGKKILVYNLYEQKWTVWDYDSQVNTRWRDFAYSTRFFQLERDTGSDNNWDLFETDLASSSGDSSNMIVETPWIKVANITGFQRVYRIQILGDYVGAGNHDVTLYYDYDNSDTETVTDQGSNVNPYIFEIRPAKQRCIAMKVRIESDPSASGLGHEYGIKLDAVVVEVGVDGHLHHLPTAQVTGAS